MKTRTKGYIYGVSLAGTLLVLSSAVAFFRDYFAADPWGNLPMLILPVALCALCRSLPVYIRENETLDLSVISVLAVYMTQGTHAAVTIFILGTLFAAEPDPETKKYRYSYAIGLTKALFNNATIVISIVAPSMIMNLTPWRAGDLSMPMVLLPVVLFSTMTFVVNGVLQLLRPCIEGQLSLGDGAKMLLSITPNVIAAMPMGYLMALGYQTKAGLWFVMMMMMPLMLARYAWKLYLDGQRAQDRLMLAFIHGLEAKDKYTEGHSARVADYAVRIGKQMRLPGRTIKLLRQGAILHDIGKIGITDGILNKPGRLTDDEFDVIKSHPEVGVSVLRDADLPDEVLEMVVSHHERMDGMGYPQGVEAGKLGLMTRILCVADAYDAMTSDRPYRKGLPKARAIEILNECAGTQFDPKVVKAAESALKDN